MGLMVVMVQTLMPSSFRQLKHVEEPQLKGSGSVRPEVLWETCRHLHICHVVVKKTIQRVELGSKGQNLEQDVLFILCFTQPSAAQRTGGTNKVLEVEVMRHLKCSG